MSQPGRDARSIFYEILDRQPVDRTVFLGERCGDDTSLRREVEDLLSAMDNPVTFFEEPLARDDVSSEMGDSERQASFAVSTDIHSAVSPSPQREALDRGAKTGNRDSESPDAERLIELPGYEVLRVLGRGGMGIVYLARQIAANRLVAVKVISPHNQGGVQERARFRTEAEAIAKLKHPGIVQIFEVGEHDGNLFFSLEHCPAGSLDRYLAGTPVTAREAARLTLALSRSIAAAHAAHVIHRDLKPANVLLSPAPEAEPPRAGESGKDETRPPLDSFVPKVTDFGLAKKLDDVGQTQSGQVLGSPSYMAPEQARGEKVGTPADIYALGAILYECVTGRPPFKAASSWETILQVTRESPVPPRQVQPGLPRDLETICLKCLSTEPGKRYVSADALADDLQRWLEGRPIEARPVGNVERAAKYVRRHPTVSALIAAVVLAIVFGAGFTAWFAFQSKANAEEASRNASIANGKALEAERKAEEARTNADRAAAAQREAVREKRAAENLAAAKTFQAAWSDHRFGNWLDAQRNLDQIPASRRGWEYEYLRHRLNAEPILASHKDVDTNHIRCLEFSPDGQFLASGDEYGAVILWNVDSKRPEFWLNSRGADVTGLAFNASSELLATGSNSGVITVWQTATGKKVLTIKNTKQLNSVLAFSGDDKMLASGGRLGSVKVWDATTGKHLQTCDAHAAPVRDVVFSPDSKRLASVDRDGVVKSWNLTTGRPDGKFQARSGAPIHFGPGGQLFCWRSQGPGMGLLNARTGRSQRLWFVFPFQDWSLCDYSSKQGWLALAGTGHLAVMTRAVREPRVIVTRGEVTAMALDPTGTWLAYADGHRIRLRHVPANFEYQVVRRKHCSEHQCHPALSEVISLSDDKREVIVWDRQGGKGGKRLKGHRGKINHRAVSPDGKYLVTGSDDKTVRVWELSTGQAVAILRGHREGVHRVFPTGNPRYLASLDHRRQLIVWDVVKGAPLRAFERIGPLLISADPTGGRVALVEPQDETTKRYELRVFDCLSATLSRFPLPKGKPKSVHFGPRGKRIAVERWNGVGITDLSTGPQWSVDLQSDGHVAFRPDGEQLAVTYRSSRTRVFNPVTGQAIADFGTVGPRIISQFFSPDGRRLVSVERDGRITIRETETYYTVLTLRAPHFAGVMPFGLSSGFAREGRDLVVCHFGRIVIWSAGAEFPHHRFADFQRQLTGVALSPNLNRIATRLVAGPLRIWDVATGKPVQVVPDVPGWSRGFSFSPDGDSLVIAREGRVEVRDVKRWELKRLLPFENDVPLAVDFRPDGKCVAVGFKSGDVSILEINSGKRLFAGKGNKWVPWKIVFSADGRRMATMFATSNNAVGRPTNGYVLVWDVKARRALARIEMEDYSLRDMDLSSDGGKLGLALGAPGKARGNGVVMIREVDTNKTLKSFEPHTGGTYGIDFSPDDKKLLTCGGDMAVRIWDASTLKELFVFYGHDSDVSTAVFGPRGNWVLSAGSDRSCHLFKATGRRGWVYPLSTFEPSRGRKRIR